MKHPDFEFETQRLEETITHIEHTITAVEDYRVKYKDNIKSAMSNLDYQESSTNYIEVLMNTQFVEIADRNYDQLLRAFALGVLCRERLGRSPDRPRHMGAASDP